MRWPVSPVVCIHNSRVGLTYSPSWRFSKTWFVMFIVLQSENKFMDWPKSWRGSFGSTDVSPLCPTVSDRHPPPHSCSDSIIVLGMHMFIVLEFFLSLSYWLSTLWVCFLFVQFNNVRIPTYALKHKNAYSFKSLRENGRPSLPFCVGVIVTISEWQVKACWTMGRKWLQSINAITRCCCEPDLGSGRIWDMWVAKKEKIN